jgi:hypothetical protein
MIKYVLEFVHLLECVLLLECVVLPAATWSCISNKTLTRVFPAATSHRFVEIYPLDPDLSIGRGT